MARAENPTGVFVSKDLRLELLIAGKGLAFSLTVEQARSIAQALLDRAEALEKSQSEAEQAAADAADFARRAGIKLD
jgi:hypothetical protein